MKTIQFTLPTMGDCHFELIATPDYEPVRGNAVASGDEALDRKIEDTILERLDGGDVWAWALVEVRCNWESFEGSDYMGGCSYEDEEDFREFSGGYFEDMKERAYSDMIAKIEALNA